MRNPLSSIDIHVQLLEEDLANAPAHIREKCASRFDVIHGELYRLDNIVKHFLSLAGPSSLDLHAIEIKKVISHVCQLLRPEAATRGIRIAMNTPSAIAIVADAPQLTQALVNLVINAIQAVDRNGEVAVSAVENKQQDFICIEVRDSGPGVPPDKHAAIFDPFFTTKAEGSGLGLWIVQQIITAHGGSVVASNSPQGGAVFTVRLPCNRKKDHGQSED